MSYLTKVIDEAIENDDRKALIKILRNICTGDPAFTTGEFQQHLSHAEKKYGAKLYDTFEEGTYPLYESRVTQNDESLIDKDFGSALVQLEKNFCPERIEDVMVLGKFVYRNSKTATSANRTINSCTEEEDKQSQKKSMTPLIIVGAILMVILLLILWAKVVHAQEEIKELRAMTENLQKVVALKT